MTMENNVVGVNMKRFKVKKRESVIRACSLKRKEAVNATNSANGVLMIIVHQKKPIAK